MAGIGHILTILPGKHDSESSPRGRNIDDADATYERAIRAGARSVEEPMDMPYGDRRGMVEDPCGNVWQIATHKRALT